VSMIGHIPIWLFDYGITPHTPLLVEISLEQMQATSFAH
jgi:hypothetical protein